MTNYDKIAHLLGTAALGLITISASMKPGTIPAWLIIVCAVVAFATGTTTSPVMQKPTLGEAVDKAKIGCILLLGLALGVSSCAHAPAVVDCAMVDVAPYAEEITTDLASQNWADLDALAVTKGVPFVICLVRAFVGKTGAGPSEAFGNDWIRAHGG